VDASIDRLKNRERSSAHQSGRFPQLDHPWRRDRAQVQLAM